MASTLHAMKNKLIFRYDNFEACWIIIVHHFHCQNNHLLPLRNKVMGNEILHRQRVVRQRTERGIRDTEREVGGYVGSCCCVRVGSGVQTDATTPSNVGTCMVGRVQPIRLWRQCVMRVRGFHNVGRAAQTDPKLLRYVSAITKQKKCWELLAQKFDRFQTLGRRNNMQQGVQTDATCII